MTHRHIVIPNYRDAHEIMGDITAPVDVEGATALFCAMAEIEPLTFNGSDGQRCLLGWPLYRGKLADEFSAWVDAEVLHIKTEHGFPEHFDAMDVEPADGWAVLFLAQKFGLPVPVLGSIYMRACAWHGNIEPEERLNGALADAMVLLGLTEEDVKDCYDPDDAMLRQEQEAIAADLADVQEG